MSNGVFTHNYLKFKIFYTAKKLPKIRSIFVNIQLNRLRLVCPTIALPKAGHSPYDLPNFERANLKWTLGPLEYIPIGRNVKVGNQLLGVDDVPFKQ